jgi:hypothetical protein
VKNTTQNQIIPPTLHTVMSIIEVQRELERTKVDLAETKTQLNTAIALQQTSQAQVSKMTEQQINVINKWGNTMGERARLDKELADALQTIQELKGKLHQREDQESELQSTKKELEDEKERAKKELEDKESEFKKELEDEKEKTKQATEKSIECLRKYRSSIYDTVKLKDEKAGLMAQITKLTDEKAEAEKQATQWKRKAEKMAVTVEKGRRMLVAKQKGYNPSEYKDVRPENRGRHENPVTYVEERMFILVDGWEKEEEGENDEEDDEDNETDEEEEDDDVEDEEDENQPKRQKIVRNVSLRLGGLR